MRKIGFGTFPEIRLPYGYSSLRLYLVLSDDGVGMEAGLRKQMTMFNYLILFDRQLQKRV